VETALVCLEIYRRDGNWRLRAIGQGYADGLAGLARNFGVDVACHRLDTRTGADQLRRGQPVTGNHARDRAQRALTGP